MRRELYGSCGMQSRFCMKAAAVIMLADTIRIPHSQAARAAADPHQLVYEHAIPLRSIQAGLLKAADDPKRFHAFARRHIRPAIISKEEHRLLADKGLGSRMPDAAAPDDAMARYRHCGISFAPDDERRLRSAEAL